MLRRLALLALLPAVVACASSKANVRIDQRIALARPVETVYLAPLENATGNDDAGRIVEAAIRHRFEYAGFRLVEEALSAGAIMGGEERTPEADLVVRPALTLATNRADKIDWYWLPLAINPIGWAVIAADALIQNDIVALQVDAVLEQNGERTPVSAQGYIEQKDLDFLRGVNLVGRQIAEDLVAAIRKASRRAG